MMIGLRGEAAWAALGRAHAANAPIVLVAYRPLLSFKGDVGDEVLHIWCQAGPRKARIHVMDGEGAEMRGGGGAASKFLALRRLIEKHGLLPWLEVDVDATAVSVAEWALTRVELEGRRRSGGRGSWVRAFEDANTRVEILARTTRATRVAMATLLKLAATDDYRAILRCARKQLPVLAKWKEAMDDD